MTTVDATAEFEVFVDAERCVSSTRCIAAEPGAFSLDEDGISRPGDLTGLTGDRIVEAAKHCPVRAISVIVGGEPVELPD